MNTILDNLKSYFQNNSREQIEKDWAQSEKYDSVGPTIDDFIKKKLIMNLNEVTSKIAIDFALYLRENYSVADRYDGCYLDHNIWRINESSEELTIEECWNKFVKQYKYGN